MPKMNLGILFVVLLLAFTEAGWAYSPKKHKHKHKKAAEQSATEPKEGGTTKDEDADEMEEEPLTEEEKEYIHNKREDLRHSYSVSLPMNRNGSGTSWNPDKNPMYKYNLYASKWVFIFHGDVFFRFNKQNIPNNGQLGTQELDVRDMLAISGYHKSGLDGLFHFNAAFSTDALIAHGSGFSQLFQNANKWDGKETRNRQHPNNLLSELSMSYAYAFSDNGDIFIYGGYPAEPALGPVSYFKRPSGEFNTDAPLSHNWTDATYISYGVGTLGLRLGKYKLEGSSFTGRLPDKSNYNFNLPFFNSWSARLSYNPTSRWALQVSRGFIASPNIMHPSVDITRTTASATYVRAIGPRKYFSYTLLWGQNEYTKSPGSMAAFAEATWRWKKLVTYGRYEWVQKTGTELNLSPIMYALPLQYNIHAATLGCSYDVYKIKYFAVALGMQLTGNATDASLNTLYGQYPISGQVFIHILPVLQ